MLSRASAKIKIPLTKDIEDTMISYRKALQCSVDYAWFCHLSTRSDFQPIVYKTIRRIGLTAQLAIGCINQTIQLIKDKETKPDIKNICIRYNFPRSASLKNKILSISTINGRKKFKIKVPACYRKYFKSWKITESQLLIQKGKCYFVFGFSKEVDAKVSGQHNRILGVDFGVNKLAVTSDGNFFGKDVKHLRSQRDRLVSQLQAKGTRSAKRKLKAISGSWKRFMSWTNHNISKQIVDSLKSRDTIVLEDLKGIRQTAVYNKWVHKWSFYQLRTFIEYKAHRKGINVVAINPAYTSKTCSLCHSLNTSRHSGFFECNDCRFALDSDLNGARNIAERYMRNTGWATVTSPNVTCVDAKASLTS